MSEDIYGDIRLAQHGDRKKAGEIIAENSGLIWSVVRRFTGRGVDADDLYQLGCVGLLKAIDGFDESFGTRFSTYAVPKISGEIRRFLRDDGAVKVSRGVKEQAAQIRTARGLLEQRICEASKLSKVEYPLVALIDKDGQILYLSTGYKIGVIEQVLKAWEHGGPRSQKTTT